METGLVYLLVEVDEGGKEKYKIGVTKNDPEKRLKKLKTGNPNVLYVINSYKSRNYRKIEQWLHKKYAGQKTLANNEFFHLEDYQALDFLKDCEEIDGVIELLKSTNPYYK